MPGARTNGFGCLAPYPSAGSQPEVVPVLANRSSDSSAWKRTEGRTREGRGESSGTVAFIDSVAVQAISSRMKAERVLKGFILRDL